MANLTIHFSNSRDEQITWLCADRPEIYSIENSVFEEVLTYKGFSRGRSSLNIEWKGSKTGRTYYSGMPLLDKALSGSLPNHSTSSNGYKFKLSGKFTFKKQGTAILLAESN